MRERGGHVNIFITGIAGFIGFHVARQLAKRGFVITGVDNFNDYYDVSLKDARVAELNAEELGGRVRVVRMDIADHEALGALVRETQPDVVIHLAAQAGVRYSIENPFAYAQSNLLGHLSVLEACRAHEGLSHLVYASSSSVYGGNTKVPFSETDPVDLPVSLYAATKRADELMSSTYAHLYGIKQIGLRFFTVYGEWGRPDMAYWSFTKRMLAGEPIRVFNHGKMRRDFTYIDDIVDGVITTSLMEPVFSEGERPARIYNIGNNQPVELMRMIEILEEATGCKANMKFEGMQPGDVVETYANVDRMQADYDFAPSTPLDVGLDRFVRWYRAYTKT